MLITTIILGLTGLAFVYFWNHIREVLNNPVRDMVLKHYGSDAEQWFGRFLITLDTVAVRLRRGLKVLAGWTKEQLIGAWKWFGETFLGIDTTYLRLDNNYLKQKTVTTMRRDKKSAVRRTEETIIDIDDLPESVRQEMLKHRTEAHSVNEKNIVERQYKEKLELFNH